MDKKRIAVLLKKYPGANYLAELFNGIVEVQGHYSRFDEMGIKKGEEFLLLLEKDDPRAVSLYNEARDVIGPRV